MQANASGENNIQQAFAGTVAQRLHREEVLTDRQGMQEKVLCEGEALVNCYKFKYLGSIFTADGRDDIDIRRRIGMAVSRCGQLRFVLGASNITMETKMKIYRSAVGSLFTYGSEAWRLTEQKLRMLNGRMLATIHRSVTSTRSKGGNMHLLIVQGYPT